MDPAIMSTSVNFGKNVGVSNANTNTNTSANALSQQQQELFARFNQLSVQQPNGVKPGGAGAWGGKLGWGGVAYAGIPLPPGFAPAKPPQHPAECIDAK